MKSFSLCNTITICTLVLSLYLSFFALESCFAHEKLRIVSSLSKPKHWTNVATIEFGKNLSYHHNTTLKLQEHRILQGKKAIWIKLNSIFFSCSNLNNFSSEFLWETLEFDTKTCFIAFTFHHLRFMLATNKMKMNAGFIKSASWLISLGHPKGYH